MELQPITLDQIKSLSPREQKEALIKYHQWQKEQRKSELREAKSISDRKYNFEFRKMWGFSASNVHPRITCFFKKVFDRGRPILPSLYLPGLDKVERNRIYMYLNYHNDPEKHRAIERAKYRQEKERNYPPVKHKLNKEQRIVAFLDWYRQMEGVENGNLI